jgi:hypothetical protein
MRIVIDCTQATEFRNMNTLSHNLFPFCYITSSSDIILYSTPGVRSEECSLLVASDYLLTFLVGDCGAPLFYHT